MKGMCRGEASKEPAAPGEPVSIVPACGRPENDAAPGGAAKPRRIQLSRKKGWRMPANTVKVCRPARWGNPFNATQIGVCYPPPTRDIGRYMAKIAYLRGKPSLERCIDLYMAWLYAQFEANPDFIEPLLGKNLACWCPLDQACHADVLLELANR